ncbi:Helix-turn-helix domain protein [Polystyrenella longa]|uniref:Helix-turn-helix domain protein n=1 Tax=Polystyrenella longa TaxID=2528007 RepID=A0A518CU48_9PLAN|nr:helix-turn-helix domain-containing protein [Polystyrenella longa]QDU82752.1 Helix-turn-helix domain protein [Polystyrenella longa]
MANRYLSLEETAELLGITPDELKQIRNRNEIRGYADRGSWKFREDEVNEYRRSQRPDSDPDVPLYQPEPPASPVTPEDTASMADSSSDSDVRLVLDENLVGDDSEPEISFDSIGDSDSDVRLVDQNIDKKSDSDVKIVANDTGAELPVPNDSLSGTDSDVKLVSAESDSDVNLIQDDSDSDVKISNDDTQMEIETTGGKQSDSDVKIVETDNDVIQPISIAGTDPDASLAAESDSHVNLEPELDEMGADSDSDVQLSEDEPETGFDFGSDSDVRLVGDKNPQLEGSDSDVALVSDEDLADESGISLAESEDSDIRISGESGISLNDPIDSGISLESDDSGLALEPEDDSTISLLPDDDSGISLEMADDSGISLEDDSGISMEQDELEGTIPMMATQGGKDTDNFDTMADEFALSDDTSDDTEMLFMEDDEDQASTMAGAESADAFEMADSEFEDMESEEFELEGSLDEFNEFEGEDFDFEEDGESVSTLDEFDVFDADDDVFDEEGFETGESAADFGRPMPAGMGGRSEMVAAPAEWDGLSVGLAFGSALVMLLCMFIAIDLVRSMWAPLPATGSPGGLLIDTLGGMF